MIIGWLVIRKSRCCVLCLAFCLCVSLFSCMSSFNSLQFVPFFSLSASPLPSSFSLNLGWKGHCWILCHSAEKGNEMGMPLIFSFFLSLPRSLSWEDLPTRPEGFPDHFTTAAQSTPLSTCYPVSLHSSLCLFVSHVGDPKKDQPPSFPLFLFLFFLSWPDLVPSF